MLIQRFINVVQRHFDVASTLCNVVSTLFQRRCPTLYQRCATLENRRRIWFHFQRRINVISTLIQRWNVGWGSFRIVSRKRPETLQKLCFSTKFPLQEKAELFLHFFMSGFPFMDTDNSEGSTGRKETTLYSWLPFPSAHNHSDIYLQLCMWDDYRVFFIASHLITRLFLDEIYHLWEFVFDYFFMECWLHFNWWL